MYYFQRELSSGIGYTAKYPQILAPFTQVDIYYEELKNKVTFFLAQEHNWVSDSFDSKSEWN